MAALLSSARPGGAAWWSGGPIHFFVHRARRGGVAIGAGAYSATFVNRGLAPEWTLLAV